MIRIFKVLLAIITLVFVSNSSFASHNMGGELTYECLGNGQFVFHAKFYRDCNGIAASNALNITTTVPGVQFIIANLVSQSDISTQGFYQDGITDCPTCAIGSGGNPITGLVEEYIYESAPIVLNGTPPPAGWIFEWSECCRSYATTNIASAGSIGIALRAIMYPFNGQNTYPCYDSSPQFIERPSTIICTGLPFTYNHLSKDIDFDSLKYEFTDPLDDNGLPVTFNNGFSVLSQLPGTNQNPANIPVSINPNTGEMFFQCYTGGYYALAVKVSSFKCGVKVSEVSREMNFVLQNNCNTIFGGISNHAPTLNPPFPDPITGLFTSFEDTVIAGDTVSFFVETVDYELFNNSSPQVVTLDEFGLQYGDNFTDPNQGCLIPPCATLSPPPPLVGTIGTSTNFHWNTTVAHLGYSFSCVQFHNTYYFISKAHDNYCPANGINSHVFSITVMPAMPKPPVVNNGGVLECTLSGSYIYQWFLNRFAIPGATASTYTPVQPGVYQVLAVASNGDGNYSDGYLYNPLGLYENELFNSLFVKPNPSKDGNFVIAGELIKDSKFDITVTDILGQKVSLMDFHETKGAFTIPLNLSSQPNGVYFVKIESDENMGRVIRVEIIH